MNGGNDVVRIDPTANFFVPGSVAVNLGEGTNSLSLQTAGRIVLGSLAVAGGTGNDAIAVAGGFGTGSIITGAASIGTGGGANAVTLRRVAVGGPVAVATGDGADTLTIDASTFFNTFTANLGAGNDAIRIAQARGSATPVEFRGTVSVHAGAGNDTLLLGRAGAAGGDVNSRVIFHGGVVSGDLQPLRHRHDPSHRPGHADRLGMTRPVRASASGGAVSGWTGSPCVATAAG
jgi:hypothetical protein